MYVGKIYRILGDKYYQLKKYDLAIDNYFNSELTFEEIMRLLYKLYKQDKQVDFALQMLKYFKILLGKLETDKQSKILYLSNLSFEQRVENQSCDCVLIRN